MYKTLPLIFAAGAVAQSTITTSWFGLGFENIPVASVISADSSGIVTYRIACSYDDISEGECGIPGDGLTVTMGPSIYSMDYTDMGVDADFTVNQSCDIHGTSEAVCVQSLAGADANDPGVETETLTGTDVAWSPLYITAGFDNLSAASAGASASTTQASATGSSSSASATGSVAQSGSRTSSGASSTASSTGGEYPRFLRFPQPCAWGFG